ncbi:MAG: glutamate formimidoyltransferase, partial [Ignavibacteriales bacterium]|nr:glutamate formimidoyltransferase [Ignavibacteriales bacterium]
MKLVECVPNFSEGKDKNILNQIAEAIKSVKDINFLDIDPGEATNRTVFTFVGTLDNIVDGAFEGIKKAAELIDMTKHKGEHPRMGATDVCPFVPVSDVTMEECAELARKLGKRVGDELGIPVYLYEEAASKPERKNLADVRQGEYEGLKERFEGKDKEYWKPDFGPAIFNAKSGATAISAREFLIAYNINFNTKDKKTVHDIALNIREAGRAKRDEHGKMIKDENGNTVKVSGLFKNVKAIGWVIPEYKRAQISINMTNYKVTPLHVVMEEVRKQACERGLIVTGSEVVGLIPKSAIIETGKFYLKKMGKPTSAPENEIVDCAILSLVLNDVSEFDPKKRIIEYAIDNRTDRLVDLTVKGFANELSSDSKAPGGGSVAALNAVLAAALGAMVPNLTIGKKGYEQHFERLNEIGEKCQELKSFFIQAIDDDADAFNKVIEAM